MIANGRWNKNFISHSLQNNLRVEIVEEIGEVFTSIFRAQFGTRLQS